MRQENYYHFIGTIHMYIKYTSYFAPQIKVQNV